MWMMVVAFVTVATPLQAPRDCALGFLSWCAVESVAAPMAPQRLRLELFLGYKPSYGYYVFEQRACAEVGCQLQLDGPLLSLDALVRLWGNARSDDFFDLGLSYALTPVATLRENPGFAGELGTVDSGDGSLSYATLRVVMRRPSLFWLLKSKYLINSFGIGVALPIASGAGRSFTGGDGVKFTLGGRLGVQVPLDDSFSVGIATNYGVVWYGPRFEHVAYVGGYGVNLQWLL